MCRRSKSLLLYTCHVYKHSCVKVGHNYDIKAFVRRSQKVSFVILQMPSLSFKKVMFSYTECSLLEAVYTRKSCPLLEGYLISRVNFYRAFK